MFSTISQREAVKEEASMEKFYLISLVILGILSFWASSIWAAHKDTSLEYPVGEYQYPREYYLANAVEVAYVILFFIFLLCGGQ